MGFTGVAELAHRMESLLDALRQAHLTADEGTFQLLFRAVDALGQGVEQAAAGREPALDLVLAAALEAATGGAPISPPVPAPAEGRAAPPPRVRRATRPLGPGRDPARRRDARGARDPGRAARRGSGPGVRRAAVAGAARARGIRRPGRLPDRIARDRRGADRGDPHRRRGAARPVRGARVGRRGRRRGAASPDPRRPPAARSPDEAGRGAGRRQEPARRPGHRGRRPIARRGERPDRPPGVGDAGRGDRVADDAGRRGVRALSAAGAGSRAGPRQAHPLRRRRRGDRARPLDPGRDRRSAAPPDPERGRPRHRGAGRARPGREAARRPDPAGRHARAEQRHAARERRRTRHRPHRHRGQGPPRGRDGRGDRAGRG